MTVITHALLHQKNKKRQKKYLTKRERSDIIEKLSLRKRSLVFEN